MKGLKPLKPKKRPKSAFAEIHKTMIGGARSFYVETLKQKRRDENEILKTILKGELL